MSGRSSDDVRFNRVEHDRQEQTPLSWRCAGCGQTFLRDQGGSHPVHAQHDPSEPCEGCPAECGPVEAEP